MISTVAAAQIPDRTIYTAPDYEAFRPQTALDMVRRTPGFVLDEGDEEVRGFGGASGNVLINGARPSSKAGVLDALGRIPASQVERIELIRNASTSEAQGQATVLNVVRLAGGTSGTWSAEAERNGNGVVYSRLEASLARSVAGWRTSVKARAYWEEFPFRSLRLSRDASGELVQSTVTDLPSTLGEATLSGDASRPIAGGLLNLTGRLGHYNYYFDQPGETFLGRLPDGRPDQTQLNQLDIQRWTLELGADWTRVYGDWSLKTLGLVNYRDGSESSRERRETAQGALISRTVVESTAEPLELVGRATLSGVGASRFRPEFGGEVAYNRFDRTFALAVDGGAGLTPIPIPASNVTVEELRGEAFANLSWTLSPRWTLESGLAVEASEISVTGEADQSQSFSFVKPSPPKRAARGQQLRAEARA